MADSSSLIIAILSFFTFFYDLITLPIYTIIQRPWITYRKSKEQKGYLENPEDPYSSLRRMKTPAPDIVNLIDQCKNIGQLLEKVSVLKSTNKCFGYRQVFSEEDEQQADGKVFKKLVLSDDYTWINFAEANDKINEVVKGLIALGVKMEDKVIIYSETRMEWMLSAQALFRMGAVVTTLYASMGDEAIIHGINESEAEYIITSCDLLTKLIKISNKIPKIKHIVYMENFGRSDKHSIDKTNASFSVISLPSLVANGAQISDETLLNMKKPTRDDIAVIMYTSGSTGTPKGVMITHANFLEGIKSVVHTISDWYDFKEDDKFIGYLPLAHMLEMIAEMVFLTLGISVGYSSTLTMFDSSTGIKRGCKGDFTALRPAIFPAVPLILDRIRKSVNEKIKKKGKIMESVFRFALHYKTFWKNYGYTTPLTDKLVFTPMHKILGGEVKLIITGGAPLSPETQSFTNACFNLNAILAYGATEACGIGCCIDIYDFSLGRAGSPFHYVQMRLVDWREGNYFVTDKPRPRGEILIGGPTIAKAYYKNKEETDNTFLEENGCRWWCTGDIGEICDNGSIKIVDRKKDLVKLQFGEYISLGKVESCLKNSPHVDNVCVYGNSFYNHLVALIVPNKYNLKLVAEELNKHDLTFQEMCSDNEINAKISKLLKEHCVKSNLMKVEVPANFKLCSEEWVPNNGLVTAALKIRRKQIHEFYEKDINNMYTNNNSTKST